MATFDTWHHPLDQHRKSAGRCHILRRFSSDERGNVMIMAGLLLPAAIMAVGAAIAFSSGSASRSSMQMALDSAVLAGLSESNTADPVTVAQSVFKSNISHYASNAATDITAGFQLDGSTLRGTATGSSTNVFSGLVGAKAIPLTVKSAAIKSTIPICLLGLNNSDKGSFDINGNPTLNAPDCAVQANSTSTSGMTQEGNSATVKAKKFGVTGKNQTKTFQPPPTDASPKVNDPYASIPFPFATACDNNAKGLDVSATTTLSPGTYCGGITINLNSTADAVTLLPGIYVMVNGPFHVKGQGAVKGEEVMIAFRGKDATLRIWGNGNVNLTSPKSGPYANIQFFQDRDDFDSKGTWVSIGGANGNADGTPKLNIDGAMYFPNQNVWFFGNAQLNVNSPGVAIVGDKIWLQGNATLNVTTENRRNIPNVTVPKMSSGVRLIN